MADIREILAALSPEDRAIYTQHRNEIRRSYLVAHTETMGMEKWAEADDMFLDYVDITLALLYDRAGRMMATKDLVGDDKATIEAKINTADENLKKVDVAVSSIKGNAGGWSNGVAK